MINDTLNLSALRRRFDLRFREDLYVDGDGHQSVMCWIPPFRAARALTSVAAPATPSNTVGDWFLPADAPAGSVEGTDYEIISMGGYWVDKYLCSSPDASRTSMGTVANGTTVNAYISQPGVAPRVNQTIAHFKIYLVARFSTGGFAGGAGTGWAGKGGLITDAHWNELWVLTRINRILLHGNTAGYDGSVASTPVYHGDAGEIGVRDDSQTASYGASVTGGGPASWDLPVSDFCGNRWEFTDGLRLFDGTVYTAGKTIDPTGSYADADYTNTGLAISGVTSGNSVASYRTEDGLKAHSIAASTTTQGTGPFDGQGFWFTATGERIARRGGHSNDGALCPGALILYSAPSDADWYIGARAVLVP